MHAGAGVNVTVYLGWVTLLLVAAVQAVSAYGVYADDLTIKDYLSVWSPIATLVLGYWFRGAQQP